MKHATATINLNPKVFGDKAGPFDVSGYACEIEGEPMVLHRSVELDRETGEARLSTKQWTVSEPRTGTAIRRSFPGQTREQILASAKAVVAGQGGRDGLLAAIKKIEDNQHLDLAAAK